MRRQGALEGAPGRVLEPHWGEEGSHAVEEAAGATGEWLCTGEGSKPTGAGFSLSEKGTANMEREKTRKDTAGLIRIGVTSMNSRFSSETD